MASPVGLIAGGGQLPLLAAEGIRAAGSAVVCVGLAGQFDAALPEHCDRFRVAGVAQVGKCIRQLRRWGAASAVMVGAVRKTMMFDPYRLRYALPDWCSFRLWYRHMRHDRRSNAMLRAIAAAYERAGIHIVSATQFIPDVVCEAGVLTHRAPGACERGMIAFGMGRLRALGALDIGQTVAVDGRTIVAVEAMEGTDALIRRAARLCVGRPWTLVKAAKLHQDMRFDVPTVGPETIVNMRTAGATCLALEAHRAIMLDKPATLAAADQAGIAVVGVNGDDGDTGAARFSGLASGDASRPAPPDS